MKTSEALKIVTFARKEGGRANLSGVNLSGVNLSGVNLSGANLSGANLSGANLYGANLYRVNLSGANLYGANLSGVNLSGAKSIVKLDMIDPRGYVPVAVWHDPEWHIFSGCRWLKSIAEARKHWGRGYEGEWPIAARYLRALKDLEKEAPALLKAWGIKPPAPKRKKVG